MPKVVFLKVYPNINIIGSISILIVNPNLQIQLAEMIDDNEPSAKETIEMLIKLERDTFKGHRSLPPLFSAEDSISADKTQGIIECYPRLRFRSVNGERFNCSILLLGREVIMEEQAISKVLLTLLATYYVLDLHYPTQYIALAIFQKHALQDIDNAHHSVSAFKKFEMSLKLAKTSSSIDQ